MRKKTSGDVWRDVKKTMKPRKKMDWMTKEKKKLSKVKPFKK